MFAFQLLFLNGDIRSNTWGNVSLSVSPCHTVLERIFDLEMEMKRFDARRERTPGSKKIALKYQFHVFMGLGWLLGKLYVPRGLYSYAQLAEYLVHPCWELFHPISLDTVFPPPNAIFSRL